MKNEIIEQFCRYAKINTQSKEESETFPSTKCQFDLAKILVEELLDLGLNDAHVDDFGYVMASLPANTNGDVSVIGLIAHMDTSPEAPGANVKPQIIESYSGGDIVLIENELSIKEMECSDLKECIGHTIITSDGTTLLGADNKAGITAIMTAVRRLIKNKNILHGTIKIAFTPDEEVGRGVDHFDFNKFGADFAYTVDGGIPGEINMETFSADSAVITVTGKNIHPGVAKGIMVNAIRIIGEIVAKLPFEMAPETTEGYEPFIHPMSLVGSVENASIKMILRDFKKEGLVKQKEILENLIVKVQKDYPKAIINLEITKSYRNMREFIEKRPEVTNKLFLAAKDAGVEPEWIPIRGGTDGSRLSAQGLPTPNIFTGGCNFHSKTEWLSVDFLMKSIETIINLVKK